MHEAVQTNNKPSDRSVWIYGAIDPHNFNDEEPELTPSEQPPLANKVAIVTGGSRGIGLAIAQRLVADGARVCITGRNEDGLKEAVASMPDGSAIYLAGKADDVDHRQEVMNLVAAEFGGLDILINNAGINPVYGDTINVDLGAARKIFEVNVIGTLGWTQAAAQHPDLHLAERGGTVLNLSSVTGIIPSPGIGVYGIAKAALMHMTSTLAVELAPDIRVNAVAPAVIKTKFAEALYEGREEEVAAKYPLKRLGEPKDVANAVAYLVSGEASWITGQTLVIDGGLMSVGGSA